MHFETDIAVIGGGVVGLSIAWGLQQLGRNVIVVDEGDTAFRASRGNFGLVWVQGKGDGFPAYVKLTRQSAALWPEFAQQLGEESGIDLEFSQQGGLDYCLDESEAENNIAKLERIRDATRQDYPYEYLKHGTLKKLVPDIGSNVVGATYCHEDGHVNPLYLLRALYKNFKINGGRLVSENAVVNIEKTNDGFCLHGGAEIHSEKIVLCAGLGNRALGKLVGLNVPVIPNRGHLLITERIQPFLKYPSIQVRQTGEGTIQIGDSSEDAGFNDQSDTKIVAQIARRAQRILPLLGSLHIVRSWAALRVMSPDGFPIYQESISHPGAYVVTCHSGITLAAIHAGKLAPWIAHNTRFSLTESFSGERFSI